MNNLKASLRSWLQEWLLVDECWQRQTDFENDTAERIKSLHKTVAGHAEQIHLLQNEIRELRAEVTKLMVAQYVPPVTPEPQRKVIQTRTMREFNAILEREFEAQEANYASGS